MLYKNILKTIGNTPSIKVKNININNTNIYNLCSSSLKLIKLHNMNNQEI